MKASNAAEVAHWMTCRENARKGIGTTDRIINTYRFCNVRREDDRVTRWLKKHWRDPYWATPNFVGAMTLARMINWPPTLEYIGYPDPWDEDKIVSRIHALSGKVWTSAYVITTCGKPMDKAVYVVRTVCGQAKLPTYRPRPGDTLQAVWTRLRGIDGLGAGFIAAQVVADLKYTPLLADAADWWTFAVPGPGSRRGLNRYYNYPVNAPWSDDNWQVGLSKMINEVSPLLPPDLGKLHAQDWQNVMCEYDKWKRAYNGEGRPRQHYRPTTSYQV